MIHMLHVYPAQLISADASATSHCGNVMQQVDYGILAYLKL